MNRTLRSLMAMSALVPFLATNVAHGYTTEVFDAVNPVAQTTAAHESKQGDGPEHVDASGAAVYSIPIPTAPNRGGLVPELALTYSSRNPIRGGIAMGWNLSIPRIELDTSDGRFGELQFTSSLGGPLILSSDPVEDGWTAYRGREDDSYTRYEMKRGGWFNQVQQWRARTSDGRVLYFGETDESRDLPHLRAPGAHEGRWFVTRIVDRFGNEVHFTYEKVYATAPEGQDVLPVDIALDRIEYGANPGAGLGHHVRIQLDYAPSLDLCAASDVPIGAQLDFRTGYPLYLGAKRLTAVVLEVAVDGTFAARRRLDLDYDPHELACTAATGVEEFAHAPLRILTAARETAYAPDGVATAMPPTTFTYNRRQRTFDTERAVGAELLPAGLRENRNGFGRDTTTRMLLDLDGDARPDKLALDEDGSDLGYCTASYAPNQGGSFGAASRFGVAAPDRADPVLPAIPWKGAVRDPGNEYCSLTHQVSQPVNYDVWDPWGEQACDRHDTPTVTYPAVRPDEAETHHLFRFIDVDADGRPDLVTGIESFPLAYRAELDARVAPTIACTPGDCAGNWIDGVGCVIAYPTDQPNCDPETLVAEQVCGSHVLRVHQNLGGGAFGPARAWSSPVPLDSRQFPDGHAATTLVDLDGDGLLDAVSHDAFTAPPSLQRFLVHRGQPGGGFEAAARTWPLPAIWGYQGIDLTYLAGWPSVSGTEEILEEDFDNCPPGTPPDNVPDCAYRPVGKYLWTYASLADINGDGLPDYVDSRGTAIRVFYNTGGRFETYDGFAAADRGTSLHDLVSETPIWGLEVSEQTYPPFGPRNGGTTRRLVEMADFDGDGLDDLVVAARDSDDHADLYINLQDRFVHVGSPAALRNAEEALAAGTTAGGDSNQGTTWSQPGDFVDLDGDGLPEAIHDGVARSDGDTQPLRLLQQVDNGRGLTVEYRYRAVSGEGVPHPVWVVTDLTTNPGPDADGAPTSSSTTTYAYAGAEYNQDLDGDWGFRGFAETTITAPSGARTVSVRSFDLSYAGLVTELRVEDAPGHAASITRMTYGRDIIPGWSAPGDPGVISDDPVAVAPSVVTHHLRTREIVTCGVDQTPADCLASGSRRAETHRWVALPQSWPALWVPESEWVGDAFAPHPGMQVQAWGFEVISDAGRYQVLPAYEVRYAGDEQGGYPLVGYTAHGYDPSKRVEVYRYRWSGSNYAITTFGHDMATGNTTRETSPNRYGTGVVRTYDHDPTRTFVARTVNELGHEVLTRHDPATGTLLEQRGPNAKLSQASEYVREGWVKTIDGFGRTLTEGVAIDDAVLGYRMVPIARASYVDAPRVKVTREARIELDEDRWARTEVELDGLGREVVTRTFAGTTLQTLARSYFDAAGNLVRARVPKPESWDLSTVDWQFVYDPLGRIVKEVQPARAGCSADTSGWAFCGQTWAYDGRTTTRADVTGTLGGEVSETSTTVDAFGRLVRVEEATAGDPAITTYAYDGNDNVRSIVNADGVVTMMVHDLLGRRTQITRGARTWTYGYDGNGNLTSILAPRPPGAAAELYTTTIAYDDLNRETSRLVGTRDLTGDELALFGDGTVVREYDLGDNAIGRLSQVTQDHGDDDVNVASYGYDARGLLARETRTMSVLGGLFADERTTARTYTAQGLVKQVTTADGDTEAGSTRFAYKLDDRGLPYVVYRPGEPGWVEQVQRTSDGRVYHQFFYKDGILVTRGLWSFDVLGRVTAFHAQSALPGQTAQTSRATEIFSFDGAGNVSSMQSGLWPDTVPSAPATWTFAHDPQHQLVGATGALGYDGAFAYSPGGRVTRAAVSASPAAVRVHDRVVDYTYGDGATADPDAPVALGDGTVPWMTIGYDLAGNATTRTIAGQSYQHRYDGADLQRDVIAPDGSRELSWYGPDRMRTLVLEVASDGTIRRLRWSFAEAEIWYGPGGTIEREAATATIDGASARFVDHERRELLYHDPRGHLLAVVDEEGTLRAGFHHGPYGELLEEAGTEEENHLERFNGKQWSPTSGLSYYGYRHYDEYALTWTQADPKYRFAAEVAADEPRRGTLYAFSLGNPVHLVDRDGLDVVVSAGGFPKFYPGNTYKAERGKAARVMFFERKEVSMTKPGVNVQVAGLWAGQTESTTQSAPVDVRATYSVSAAGEVTFESSTAAPQSPTPITVGLVPPQGPGQPVTSATQTFQVPFVVHQPVVNVGFTGSIGVSGDSGSLGVGVIVTPGLIPGGAGSGSEAVTFEISVESPDEATRRQPPVVTPLCPGHPDCTPTTGDVGPRP